MPTSPSVIFFDVNETLLDLQPVKKSVARALGGREELVSVWFTTLLQYSLVATVGDHYTDFGSIGAATLRMVARQNGMDLSEAEAKEVLKPIRSLPPHADVSDGLHRLKESGFRLFTLTNSATGALNDQMTNSGLKPFFEDLYSVESVGRFKPHRDVYAWASEQVGEAPENCMLVAAHGWDIAGAGWAGMRTAFIERPGQTLYPLAERPDYSVPTLIELAKRLVAGTND
ncbi:haloacid dehalogenase type II [Lewinella sp. JB7]|uniref:haloacid dehalogenase type II n=1 Tax=Lewinella sp. JB7 TaxID=2962887 RepID=UPI0020C97D0A|nr:haloacid dehalogenase type II [Lewinella sp. JB7]MCP9237835.1 haloacid dehalogenase type II [Lewinella sp. JB7]